MATYDEIKKYIRDEHKIEIKSCYIANVKEICRLPLKKAGNRTEYKYRKNPCPRKHIEVIKQAFRHFDMI